MAAVVPLRVTVELVEARTGEWAACCALPSLRVVTVATTVAGVTSVGTCAVCDDCGARSRPPITISE